MDLFHQIEDAEAIVRVPGGIYKQTKVFRRGERVFVQASGGFVRVCCKFGDAWGTSNPKISVIDMSQDIPGFFVGNDGKKEPRWTGKTTA